MSYIHQPQPGVVIAVVGSGLAGYLVGVGQAIAGKPSLGTHVVGVTHQDAKGRWMGIEGRPGGVGLVDCTPYLADSRARSNYLQPKPDDHGQLAAFLAGAAKSLGIGYDWAGIAGDIADTVAPDLSADIDHLWRWPTYKGQLPGHVVCSSLFAALYDLPQVGWQHPDLGKERMCLPEAWWNWCDGELWASLGRLGDTRCIRAARQTLPLRPTVQAWPKPLRPRRLTTSVPNPPAPCRPARPGPNGPLHLRPPRLANPAHPPPALTCQTRS